MTRRVLWIHQNFVGEGQAGNARARQVVEGWLEHGFDVDVVASQEGYLGPAGRTCSAPLEVEHRGRSTIYRLSRGGRSNGPVFERRAGSYLDFLRRADALARRLDRPDVLFASTPPLPQIWLALALAARWRLPLVLEVRDLWPAFLVEVGTLRRSPLLPVLEWLEALAFRAADRCIVAAPAFAPYACAMGVDGGRLAVVPSGAEARWAEPPRVAGERWRREHGLERERIVLYAGSFNEAYDLERVLEVADVLSRSCADVCWILAGDGRARARVERRAAALRCVRWVGCLPQSELAPLYAAADAAVVTLAHRPLLRTVVPGKLLHAMASGLPILCWAGGQPALLVETAGAGLVLDHLDSAAAAAAVAAFLDRPEAERRTVGRRGRAWVLERLPASDTGRRVAQVLHAACESSPRRRRLATAGFGAALDVATRRSQRALTRLYRRPGARTVETSFAAWLAARETGAAIASRTGES
jgi:glycosyltransferase involved in cell wall biosynthesis